MVRFGMMFINSLSQITLLSDRYMLRNNKAEEENKLNHNTRI